MNLDTAQFSDVDALKRIVLAEPSLTMDLEASAEKERAELVNRVNENYAIGVGYRKNWMDDRDTSIKFFEHHQWSGTPGDRSQIQITINRVKPAIETVMGLISRTKMMVALEGVGPEDAIKGAIMNTLFEESCRKDGAEFIHHENLKESSKAGLGVGKETWDWMLDFPFGMPRLELIPSKQIIIQPGAKGLQYEDANWIIHEVPFNTDELKVMYPEYANEIKPDEQWLKDVNAPAYWHSAYPRRDLLRNTSLTGGASGPSIPQAAQEAMNITTLKEMWYKKSQRVTKQFALKDIPRLNVKAGKEIQDTDIQALGMKDGVDFVTIPMANYQMRVAKVLNNILLSDVPTPNGHNKFPFVFFKANPLDDYTYPASHIIYMIELQEMLNKLYSMMADYAIRTANSPIFVPELSDKELKEKLEKYWNFPGLIVPLPRGAKPPTTLQLPPISESLIMIARQVSASLDELLGVRGDRVFAEPAQASGKALGEMRLNADIFHAPKSNPIQYALLWWADMRVQNIKHLMRQDRMVKIDERLAKQIEGTAHKNFLESDPLGGQYYRANRPGLTEIGEALTLNDLSEGEFDIKVTLAGDYAETKRSEVEMAIGLKKMDIIDAEATLEAVDFPNRDEIARRMDEKNTLLQMGKQVAEDPLLMALIQKPELRQTVEMMLVPHGAPGGNGRTPTGQPPTPTPQGA